MGAACCRMEGLDSLANLQVLVLASNKISAVENIGLLSKLQVLNMQDNSLKTIAAINLPLLAQLPLLATVCFQNIDLTASNPVCQSSGYKASIVQQLPALRNLDGER
jgi:Leucine-rich repeat (LRR) protein